MVFENKPKTSGTRLKFYKNCINITIWRNFVKINLEKIYKKLLHNYKSNKKI